MKTRFESASEIYGYLDGYRIINEFNDHIGFIVLYIGKFRLHLFEDVMCGINTVNEILEKMKQ